MNTERAERLGPASPSSVATFIAGTIVYSWAIWFGLLLAARIGIISHESPANWYGLGGIGPSATAFILSLRSDGWFGVKSLGARVLAWRVPLRWYAFALFVPAVIRLIGLGLYAATGGTLLSNPIAPVTVIIVFLISMIVPLFEEFGWRGYMLPALLIRWPPVRAGLYVGIVWAAWHIPLFWIEGTALYRLGQASGLPVALAGYSIAVVALSMLFTLMFYRTNGNLLLAFLLHDATNTSADVMFAPYQHVGILGPGWWSIGVMVMAGSLACLALLRNRPLAHDASRSIRI